MIPQLRIVIELPEGSCSPQILEHILCQARNFFDRLSSGLRESTGQRLRVTIGPWEAQQRSWAGEYSTGVPQSSHNDALTSTPLDSQDLVIHDAFRGSPLQDDGLYTLVQQQGPDAQILAGEGRNLESRSTQGMRFEDSSILFAGHNSELPFDAPSSPGAGEPHLYRNPLETYAVDGQFLQPPQRLLPSNAASPSNTQENDVSPQVGDETLIRRAANNLSARPISEFALSQEDAYTKLRWENPRSPADFVKPGPDKSSKSHSPSRKRG